MRMRTFGVVCALSLSLGGAAFAATADQPGHHSPVPGTSSESVSAAKDAAAGAVGTVSAEMTTTTKGFVTAAATGDIYEVEAGKIAQARGQSQGVRDFGRHMVEAHTQTSDQLKTTLAGNHIDVALPAHLDDRRQGMVDDLRGAKPGDFDHRYLVQQEAAHKEAGILMRGYARRGDNDAMRTFAANTLPKVEDHLSMIEKLQADMKTAAR